MTQQFINDTANRKYRLRLFVDKGIDFVEVRGKILAPYTPPEPAAKFKEHRITTAPSHIHHQGFASYRVKLRLYFSDRESYAEYMAYAHAAHKFYDEKGAIFLGGVEGMTRTVYQGTGKSIVELSLVMIKKDTYEQKHRAQFLDLVDVHRGEPMWYAQDVHEMADSGLIALVNRDGSPVLYFDGDKNATRAEFVTFLNRTRRWAERVIRE
ncbi:hypothetical protein DCCM_0384 [Desulfocucumis palustris]|uniref:SLH domain-containing protein n=1 Tax=Desulfocucumis palustris TaxID=1898651 RepID=A0A2L2X9B9_9FIRM|nr:S-layer homology domain-containing protein [Desulfocucumis palustris]GBF32193.1 hypothetical protein DCCM_0384 [Desulfocucumis palustris]